jgi:hypothetical protein
MMKLHTGHAGRIVSEEKSAEAAGEANVEGRAKSERGLVPGSPPPREAGLGRGER